MLLITDRIGGQTLKTAATLDLGLENFSDAFPIKIAHQENNPASHKLIDLSEVRSLESIVNEDSPQED